MFVTPQDRLGLEPGDTAPPLDQDAAARLESAFARGPGHGLLQLGAGEIGTALPPVLSFWRDLGARYVTALCTLPNAAGRDGAERDATGQAAQARPAPPPEEEVEPLARAAPPMTGAEYVTAALLRDLWGTIDAALMYVSVIRTFVMHERALRDDDFEMTGVLGRISMPVREQGGTGELIYSQQGTRRSCGARSEQGSRIERGTEVVVMRYEKGIAWVRPWDELHKEEN